MMDTVKNFLRGIMDIAFVVIPLTVVLGVIFPGMGSVPFIGSDALGEISRLVSSLGSNGLVGIITLGILWALMRR